MHLITGIRIYHFVIFASGYFLSEGKLYRWGPDYILALSDNSSLESHCQESAVFPTCISSVTYHCNMILN